MARRGSTFLATKGDHGAIFGADGRTDDGVARGPLSRREGDHDPLYAGACLFETTGRNHVVALLGAEAVALFGETLGSLPDDPVTVLLSGPDSAAMPLFDRVNVVPFPTVSALLRGLSAILAQGPIGMRAYALGPDAFLSAVDDEATALGLDKSEVVKVPTGFAASPLLVDQERYWGNPAGFPLRPS